MFSLNSVKLIGTVQTIPSYSEATSTSQSRIWFKLKITPEQQGTVAHSIGIIGWDKNANNIAQYCSKGHQLLIEGKLESRVIHTDEGFISDVNYIIIEKVKFGEGKRKNVPIYSPTPEEHFDNKPSHQFESEQEEEEYPDFQDPDVIKQPNTNMLDALKKLGIGTDEILDLVKADMTERRKAAL